jgi:hypothetical protein
MMEIVDSARRPAITDGIVRVIATLRGKVNEHYPDSPLRDDIEAYLIYMVLFRAAALARDVTATQVAREIGAARSTVVRKLGVLVQIGIVRRSWSSGHGGGRLAMIDPQNDRGRVPLSAAGGPGGREATRNLPCL